MGKDISRKENRHMTIMLGKVLFQGLKDQSLNYKCLRYKLYILTVKDLVFVKIGVNSDFLSTFICRNEDA